MYIELKPNKLSLILPPEIIALGVPTRNYSFLIFNERVMNDVYWLEDLNIS